MLDGKHPVLALLLLTLAAMLVHYNILIPNGSAPVITDAYLPNQN
jgi:hypothetical protein